MLLNVIIDDQVAIREDNNQVVLLASLQGHVLFDVIEGVHYTVEARYSEVDCPTCGGYGECCSTHASFTLGRDGLREIGQYKSNPDHNGYHDMAGAQCISCHGSGAREDWVVRLNDVDPEWMDDEVQYQARLHKVDAYPF